VSAAASGRTILAFILENPSFDAHGRYSATGTDPLLLTDFVAACLLQIRKIATILRQVAD
jgi:hypothetical protein